MPAPDVTEASCCSLSFFLRWRNRNPSDSCVSDSVAEPQPAEPESAAPKPVQTEFVRFGSILLKVPDVDPRWCTNTMPLLHSAAKACDLPQLQHLLDQPNCNIDEINAGETALHLAAEEGHSKAVVLLIDRGANVNSPNQDGWGALHSAAQSENTDTVALLLARGADVHMRTKIHATALHMAAFNGRLGAVKVLIMSRADVLAKDKDGYTPLDDAMYRSSSCPCQTAEPERMVGFSEVIAFLEKVTPMQPEERQIFAQRSWGLLVVSKLQEASEHADMEELARLLECYGQYVNAQDFDGSTALHSAAEAGHLEAVRLLLDRNADVHMKTNCKDSAIHFSAREGHLAVTKLLVARGSDAQALTKFGATPLDHAVREGHSAVIKLLEGS
mmetsp:Transcript_33839/g.55888  ORF Transcript_33839/g.55888 Transcript_33839/m.55888 type:complete len:387 (+) Transcript_33839:83-1243(+)